MNKHHRTYGPRIRAYLLLAAAIILADAPLPAAAAESADWVSLPQAERSLQEPAGFSLRAMDFGTNSQSRLNEKEQELYTKLKTVFTEIAEGTRNRAEFTVDIQITGTCPPGCENKEAAIRSYLTNDLCISKVVRMLLADCPYELYWFHKSRGYQTAYALPAQTKDGTFQIRQLSFSFFVADDFAVQNEDGTYAPYLIDGQKAAYAQAAKAAADQIVEKYAACSDYEKLCAYRTEICARTAYDQSASQASKIDCNGPWQMTAVFDGDASTNAVCEGYSKAFAYLCEASDFEQDIRCYLVSGELTGNSDAQGAGGHMWNIVTIGDSSYLTDITNCDEQTIGAPDHLFLAGLPGSADNGYTFTDPWGRQAAYTYSASARELFPLSVLTLSPTGYDPTKYIPTEPGTALTPNPPADTGANQPPKESSSILRQTVTNSAGRNVAVTITTQTDPAGTVISRTKQSILNEIAAHTTAVVTVKETARTVRAEAAVTQTSSSGNTAVVTKSILSQITEAADGRHPILVLAARGNDGKIKYKLKADTKDLTAGSRLCLYRIEPNGQSDSMVNADIYTVRASGSLSVPIAQKGIYRLVTKSKAEAAAKAIRATVTAKKSITLKPGKRTAFPLNSKCNPNNLQKAAYTSSKKAVASVSKNGTIAAKQAGIARIRADITLRDGSSKTVYVQVTVK